MIGLNDEEIAGITHCVPYGSTYSARDNEVAFSWDKVRELNKAQLKKCADEIGEVLDEPDDKLRLALGYVWQALLETG